MDQSEIQIYDGLLPDEMLQEVLDLVRGKGFQYGWKSNKQLTFSHWNLGFSETGVNSKNREDITDELPDPIRRIWEQIQPMTMPENPVLLRAYCNAHTYGTEGYIHRDSEIDGDLTAIIYLNKSWKGNWAGETVLFEDREIVKAVMPKWNRLFLFPSNMKHAGRGVSRFCPEARTVLVFKASKY
jgi:SM-20-related protein